MVEKEIISILEKDPQSGFTITELVTVSQLPRSAVRIALAKLEGAEKVSIRKAGMAKIYFLKKNQKKTTR